MPGTIGHRSPTAPDQGVCAISPSDLVGYVGNLMNTVNDLKQRVAELEAKNTETNQLSNISGQVGWVGGVTYMGIPGWTQTEYGTLIPPPGFTLSQLGFTLPNACTGEETPYQGVVMKDNGDGTQTLQVGWTPAGEMCGEKVQAWDNALSDYALYYSTSGMSPSNPHQSSRGIDILSVSFPGDGVVFSANVSQEGIYLIQATCNWGITIVNNGSAIPNCTIETYTAEGSGVSRGRTYISDLASYLDDFDGSLGISQTDGNSGGAGIVGSGMFYLNAGANVQVSLGIELNGGAVVSSATANTNISVLRVGPVGT